MARADDTATRRWLKFAVGLGVLTGLFLLLAVGPTPPGAFGAMIDRNVEEEISANPLFYMDHDSLIPLQAHLAALRADAP